MKRRWITTLALAGLASLAACGGGEDEAAEGGTAADTSLATDGTGIAGQGGMDGTVGAEPSAIGQSTPSDSGGFGAGGTGGSLPADSVGAAH